ncbi:hypothetical protein PoB_002105000 [Plakobranchus ocellatus]|uniref:EGF-like domain-containing protein n=1 Tax=Plakobranchus ocellatus TaxID=259542 RepID=A0AAV3ZHC6_9GAST|nr:hypothetical protein PoB_002105000 [Plakobranchus ocellatus]
MLVSSANSGPIRGAVLTCHPRDRDPCANFPDLCSAGNGLCVVKKPCEYECVCPPDGRVGRDCSSGGTQRGDALGKGTASSNDNTSGNKQVGTLLDSLLVFPPDLFWDLNHVAEQNDLIKTMPVQSGTTATPTASLTTESSKYLGLLTTGQEKIKPEMTFTESANTVTAPNIAPASEPVANFKITTVATSPLLDKALGVTPASYLLTATQPGHAESTVSGQPLADSTDFSTSTTSKKTSPRLTNVSRMQTPVPVSKEQTTTVTSRSDSLHHETITDATFKTSQPLRLPHDPSTRHESVQGAPSNQPLHLGKSGASDSTSRISSAILPTGLDVQDSVLSPDLSGGFSQSRVVESGAFPAGDPPEKTQLEASSVPQSTAVPNQLISQTAISDLKYHGVTSATVRGSDLTDSTEGTHLSSVIPVDKSDRFNSSLPGLNSFPTFFTGDFLNPGQDTSNNKALNRMVQRVFHPVEAFQMLPRL